MRLVLVIPAGGRHDAEQRIALRERPIEIGGAADCDAVVDHPSVGTSRVRLERRGEDWVAIDRDGRGACSVGGVPLRPREPRIVRPPHTLRLGVVDVELVFDTTDDGPVSTREVALRAVAFVGETAPPNARIRVVEGRRIGDTLEMAHGAMYRVGRGNSCDLFLDAEDASREHFTIECHPGRVVVKDVGSAKGTFLGGGRLVAHRSALWEPSRMLRAADSVFSLEVARPGAPERLLAPLANLEPRRGELALREPEVERVTPASALQEPPPALQPTEQPERPAGLQTASEVENRPRRRGDPRLVIVVLAALLAVIGVASLIALLLA